MSAGLEPSDATSALGDWNALSIGSTINLISQVEIRYEGLLYTIDPESSTAALAKVRSLAQKTDKQIVQYRLEMKCLNTLYSVGVILRTSLFVSRRNRNALCLGIQLLLRPCEAHLHSSQWAPMDLLAGCQRTVNATQQFDVVGVAGSSLTSFGTETSNSGTLSQSSAAGSAFTQDTRSLKTQLSQEEGVEVIPAAGEDLVFNEMVQ
ncbi:hypothetical protein MC885_002518 [Smutsia gigantea]|nr:hypothetical protein MC885_002518 [Smutsia gigantea]